MTVECKTGCGKQVEYEKIVFDDGFIFHLPRNPDLSFHFCEIFHDENSLFSNPRGGYSYDGNPLRENSYGYEIIDYDQFLFDFDYFIMERNKSLSKDDILQYKHQLQSRIIHLPILGLYTDVLGGLYTGCLDEKVSKKFINCIFFNKKIHPENDKLCYFNSTLGSDPLESLKAQSDCKGDGTHQMVYERTCVEAKWIPRLYGSLDNVVCEKSQSVFLFQKAESITVTGLGADPIIV